jgi:heat shock protein HslJ
MLRILTVAAIGVTLPLTLAGCASTAGASAAPGSNAEAPSAAINPFRATGNEPSWRLDVNAGEMTLLTNFGQTRLVAPLPQARTKDGKTTYVGRTDQGDLTANVVDTVCMDSMSGMPHPQSVTVVLGEQTLTGCGGEPASLLHGAEWTAVSIDGKPLVAGSKPTLSFAPDGRLTGHSSCNRYMTQYTLSGEGLAIGQPAGTRMMCEAPLMDQEQAFLSALSSTQGFAIAADGSLLLRTGDGRTVEARR